MPPVGDLLSFDHVQMYVSSLRPVHEYHQLEEKQGMLSVQVGEDVSIEQGREAWKKICHGHVKNPAEYSATGQDPVEQLIVAMGWRVSAHHEGSGTRTIVLSSSDPKGAVFVATAASEQFAHSKSDVPFYSGSRVHEFTAAHNGRFGFGVLAFKVQTGSIELVMAEYKKSFPELLVQSDILTFNVSGGTIKVFEAYAYRMPDLVTPDKGTTIRYIERSNGAEHVLLPDLIHVNPKYDPLGSSCYSDHWVSNVVDRKDFLHIMETLLGFSAKVDFNAGVVGAGEAVIESTVTGNSAASGNLTLETVLMNQSQIYLPTNNALSEHGHVRLFLKEIGQGIQHIANRCKDLVRLISRTNAMREITGQGFSFLRIPRSYYGRLSVYSLSKDGIPEAVAAPLIKALEAANLLTAAGIVNISITDAQAEAAIRTLPAETLAQVDVANLVAIVKRGRYNNLYKLLREHLTEETYLRIVANQVLVDIQGQDILYQIFTSSVMQAKDTDEAPFFEFIQRVCSEQKDANGNPKAIRPGCGGFGIRNFLTLFLSIEVSKAMQHLDAARAQNNTADADYAQGMIDIFTSQLEESNPILTGISDAMTAEADARDEAERATDAEAKAAALAEVAKQAQLKLSFQDRLMDCGVKHKALMADLRTKYHKQ